MCKIEDMVVKNILQVVCRTSTARTTSVMWPYAGRLVRFVRGIQPEAAEFKGWVCQSEMMCPRTHADCREGQILPTPRT